MRGMWIHPILSQRRLQMRLTDPDTHIRYLRISKERIDLLLQVVSAMVTTKATIALHNYLRRIVCIVSSVLY